MSEAKQILESKVSEILKDLGYELVACEVLPTGRKTLRVFIDRAGESAPIGIEDCVAVTRALDEPLESIPELEKLFEGPYELEVSSPGVDRPLRGEKDYVRFQGKLIRVHVFRPLTAGEIENPDYQQKNPKQKNFIGTLEGVCGSKLVLAVKDIQTQVLIPFPLIAKANLEPVFEFEKGRAK